MSPVLSLASVTFREVVRRKVQVNLLLFGAVLIVGSFLVSELTLGEMHRILSDLGLSAMQIIGTLIAVFVGATLVAGDVERRVLYPVIAKPVSRTQYLLGRYLGLAAALLVNLAVMAAVLSLVLVYEAGSLAPLDGALATAVAFQGVQFVVVGAVAILFSSLSSSTLAAIFTLAIAIAGQLTNEMRALWQGPATWVPQLLWYLLPNLGSLTANEAVIYRTPPPASAWLAALYGLLYAATALALASAAFERRDLR
ncbi:MAG: ABC transporter permease subunit [Deltaproteobacteria bacterium]|nr:ABC transporter permease subunit [Deltaproteobacteria bacterium]